MPRHIMSNSYKYWTDTGVHVTFCLLVSTCPALRWLVQQRYSRLVTGTHSPSTTLAAEPGSAWPVSTHPKQPNAPMEASPAPRCSR